MENPTYRDERVIKDLPVPFEPRFQASQQTGKLDVAFAKAQGEFLVVSKDKQNPHFKSSFASLASVWAAVRPALAKHQVLVTQWPLETEGKRIRLLTRVSHQGEFYQSLTSIPTQDTPQGNGSSYTYLRRYALLAILGLADDDMDDDAETAQGRDPIADAKPVDWEKTAVKRDVKNFAPKVSPMQQVSNVINMHKLDAQVVGRFVRFRYPGLDIKTMDQKTADQVIAVLVHATDEKLESMMLPPGGKP